MGRISQKDIAARLNISLSTVNRALNDKPDVEKEMKSLVIQTAKELGYRKNLVARGLKYQKTNTIGVVLPNISNPFFSQLLHGIEDAAQKNEYSILLANTSEDTGKERKAISVLEDRMVDGLIIVPVRASDDICAEKEKYLLPHIFLGRTNIFCNKNSVRCDDFYGGYIATRYLLDKGHKNILCLTGPRDMEVAIERKDGYIKAFEDARLAVKDENIVEAGEFIADGYEAVKQIDLEGRGITAIFSFNDLLAIGSFKAINEEGLEVPQNVAVVGYDDIELSKHIYPSLTTVKQPTYAMGAKAADMMVDILKNENKKSYDAFVFKPELIRRDSA